MDKHFQESLVLHFNALGDSNARLRQKVIELEQANTVLSSQLDFTSRGFRWWDMYHSDGYVSVYVPNDGQDYETSFVTLNIPKMPSVRVKFEIKAPRERNSVMRRAFLCTLERDPAGGRGKMSVDLLFLSVETMNDSAPEPLDSAQIISWRSFDVCQGGLWYKEKYVQCLLQRPRVEDLRRVGAIGPGGSLCLRFSIKMKQKK